MTLEALQQGAQVMVGVNKFRVDEEILLKYPPTPETTNKAMSFKLLQPQRIAQTFER